jgi:hypothetical protein
MQKRMDARYEEMVAEFKPETGRDDGLPRNDGGTSRRGRADLSGKET